MKNLSYLWLCLLMLCCSCGERVSRQAFYGIVPKPVSADFSNGIFKLTAGTKICLLNTDSTLFHSAHFFNSVVEKTFGKKMRVITSISPKKGAINVSLDPGLKEEAYHLTISPGSIEIKGGSPKGVFYAFQSLRQLLPQEVLKGKLADSIELPESNITDEPGFGYRGAMLDVGRFFFTVDQVKEFIDVLAMHKMNIFHWHLTEDYGWRIEIKKYPNLTKIGSVREKSVHNMVRGKPIEFDDTPHGGFYTQEEIKEVVKYAADRFITIIPEIELPGHATAALASYPYLGCKGKDYKVETIWRVTDEAFCAGRDSTFEFLDDVFTEVASLFPSEYIHVGGDECRKIRWKNCPMCQKRIRDEKLKDETELQSYFIQRIEKILNAKGKKLIGWDEILEGGVSPTATVMSWRGIDGGVQAAKKGNHVIMSPSTYCYFDFYQSKDTKTEPLSIGGYIPVDSVYFFDPLKGLTAGESQYIMGVQANIWTAFMKTTDIIYYMALPRLAALAEVGWSYKNSSDYPDFKQRMEQFRTLYETAQLPYAKYMFDEPENETIKQ